MTLQINRVSLAFTSGREQNLLNTAGAVSANLYNIDAFDPAPVTKIDLDAAITAVLEAKAAMAQGGTSATETKNNKREELIVSMKSLALHVDAIAQYDLALMLSSGFEAISRNRTSEELPAPESLNIEYGPTGSVRLTVQAVKNAKSYETGYALIDDEGNVGEWQSGPPSTSSRNMEVGGLVSGQMYVFRVRAIGGSAGVSDWSGTTNHRAA